MNLKSNAKRLVGLMLLMSACGYGRENLTGVWTGSLSSGDLDHPDCSAQIAIQETASEIRLRGGSVRCRFGGFDIAPLSLLKSRDGYLYAGSQLHGYDSGAEVWMGVIDPNGFEFLPQISVTFPDEKSAGFGIMGDFGGPSHRPIRTYVQGFLNR